VSVKTVIERRRNDGATAPSPRSYLQHPIDEQPLDRLARWQRLAEWPLAAAAVLFLIGYAVPILDPGAAEGLLRVCTVALVATWALFGVDYAARVLLAQRHLKYIVVHPLDLILLVVPFLRPLRLLRLLVLLRVLNRRATQSLRGQVAVYVAGAAALVIFCAALAVLDAERGAPTGNIDTFGDALWWAATTVTTVGYGDRYPTTTEGRFVAVGLMLAGIALIGVVTASFASWLIDRVRQVETDSRTATALDLNALHAEITALRSELQLSRQTATEPGPHAAYRPEFGTVAG